MCMFRVLWWPVWSWVQGEWARNMREGSGVEVLVTGERYDGQWSKNLRHGRGVIRFSSGKLRRGIWRNGEIGLWESEEYLPEGVALDGVDG